MLDVGEITKLLNASYSSLESYLYKHSTGMKWNAGQQSIDSWYMYSCQTPQCMAVPAPNGC